MTRPATSRPRMKGLWYCPTCGKRGGSQAVIDEHITERHGGVGGALQEPSRDQLLRTFIAAERLAQAARAHLDLSDFDTSEQLAAHERLGDALDDFSNTAPETGQ